MKTITKRLKNGIFLPLILIYLFVQAPAQTTSSPSDKSDKSNKTEQVIIDTFKAAKQAMYSKEWSNAINLFDDILTKSKNSSITDDSLYWLAYCLNQSSQKLEKPLDVLTQQKKALAHLETLIKNFPTSSFKDDAGILKMEIAEGLVNKGFKEYRKYIVNSATNQQNMDMKLIAIESLMQMDKNKAFPILEKIIRTQNNEKLREKALYVLSQTEDNRVIPLLKDVALNDSNIKVQEKAIFWLGQIAGKETLKVLLNIYSSFGEKDTNLKEKVVFSISQVETNEAIQQLISIYKKEKNLKLKKKIIFYLGQSDNATAASFIRDILFQ